MYKYLISIISIIVLFLGCKQEPDFTSKKFININKDAVLNAAKKVILLSDKRYNISSNENSINAKRTISIYKAYDVDLQINTINISTITENNITTAKLSIKQKEDYFDKSEKIIKGYTHNLLWHRIDYLLGLKKTWDTCLSANIKLDYTGVLCNRIYNKNNIANKYDVLRDNITFTSNKELKNTNSIADINIDEIKDIKPIFDTNNTVEEINLDEIK